MSEEITNKELYKFMSDSCSDRAVIHEKIDTQIEISKKILEQTQKTNGRVHSLERWRTYMLGAVSVLTAVILPIAFMVLNKHI